MSLSSAGVLTVSGAITSSGIITGTAFTAGSAVLAEAELELLDGLTAGTAIASKVVTTDGSIDTTGQRNLTITGELDAATGDFSGAVDVAGTTTAVAITASGLITANADMLIGGTTPTLTIGDAGAEDTKIVFDGNAQDFYIGLDDTDDSIKIGLGSTLGTTAHIVSNAAGIVTMPLQPLFKVQQTGALSVADGHNLFSTSLTEAYDVNGDVGTNGQFTAPVDGYYQFSFTVLYKSMGSGGADDSVEDQFVSSNLTETGARWGKLDDAILVDAYAQSKGDAMLFMDANDTCKIVHINGGTMAVETSVNHSHFEGYLLQ